MRIYYLLDFRLFQVILALITKIRAMSSLPKYVIYSALETKLNESLEPQFWSFEHRSWGSLKQADTLDAKNLNHRFLPFTGKFMLLKEAKSLVKNWKHPQQLKESSHVS